MDERKEKKISKSTNSLMPTVFDSKLTINQLLKKYKKSLQVT